MKTLKQISKIALITLFLFSTISSSIADEIQEKFEKTFKLSKTGEFTFSCYETDLKINTWDKDEVKLLGEIMISGGKPDDQQKLIDVFINPEISESANSLTIKTDLAKNTIIIGPFSKITLVNGKTIRVDKYKASYTLWIPESIAFNLKSKYNNIDIASLTGKLDFDLYEVDLTLASFNKGDFDMKYSSAEIGKGETAKFDVYDCEIEIKDITSFSINTKYSEFSIENAGMIAVGSYEDEFEIQNLIQGLKGQAKYSNFNIESNVEFIKMDVYESDIEVRNVNTLEYTSKYSTFKGENINSIKCKSLYETEIHAAVVGELSCLESKYDEISFQSITKSINLPSAYELDLDINAVKPSFESFYADFKYGSVNLPLDPALEFSLEFETTYGDVDFPKDRIKVRNLNIKESSKHSFEGATSENAKCKIKFKAYDTNFNLE
ncbi:hypothetical protein ACFLSE_00320 [Bacteroidota bacterium]